jgi:hypothetical protein
MPKIDLTDAVFLEQQKGFFFEHEFKDTTIAVLRKYNHEISPNYWWFLGRQSNRITPIDHIASFMFERYIYPKLFLDARSRERIPLDRLKNVLRNHNMHFYLAELQKYGMITIYANHIEIDAEQLFCFWIPFFQKRFSNTTPKNIYLLDPPMEMKK